MSVSEHTRGARYHHITQQRNRGPESHGVTLNSRHDRFMHFKQVVNDLPCFFRSGRVI